MIRSLLLFLFFGGFFAPVNNTAKRFRPIQKTFPLVWKSKVGAACFRGNILMDSSQIIFGSNGNNFMDFGLSDNLSGLYFINPKNGKIKKHVHGNKFGDMDVNGVLLYQDKLYYGNDNEEFICSSRNGDILWRLPTSGDIEHEPMLIKGNKGNMIVYATESGEACAIDPVSGKKYWSYFVPDFNGWKPGNNRAIFKVKSYFSNTQTFFTKPLIADLDRDGTDDLVYLTYDDAIIAINGKTGKRQWSRESPNAAFDYVMNNIGDKKNPIFTLTETAWDSANNYKYNMLFINAKGDVIRKKSLDEKNQPMGLNSLATSDGKILYSQENAILMASASGRLKTINRERNFKTTNYREDSVIESRNGSGALIAQTIFSYKGNDQCIMLLNQRDRAFYENGFIEIISLDSKKVLGTWQLPDASELAPVIGDANKDGILDVLINTYDGYLYCYSLGVPASNIKYTKK
jgi:outer membrane protein assembly factor BamB